MGLRTGARDRQQLPLAVGGQKRTTDERLGIGMLWRLEDRLGRPLLDDAAGIHDRDPVSEGGDDREIVGDEQRGKPALAAFVIEQAQDLCLNGDIKCRRRFVGDQKLRIAGECGRNHHTLRHAAGKLVREALRPRRWIGNADIRQKADDPVKCGVPAHFTVDPERLGHLRPHPAGRVEHGLRLLEQHADICAAQRIEFGG